MTELSSREGSKSATATLSFLSSTNQTSIDVQACHGILFRKSLMRNKYTHQSYHYLFNSDGSSTVALFSALGPLR